MILKNFEKKFIKKSSVFLKKSGNLFLKIAFDILEGYVESGVRSEVCQDSVRFHNIAPMSLDGADHM